MTVVTSEGRCEDPAHRSYSTDTKWDECQFRANAIARGLVPDRLNSKVAVGSAVDECAKAVLLDRPFDIESSLRSFYQQYGVDLVDFSDAAEKATSLLALWEREVRPAWEQVGVWGVDVEEHFPIEGGIIYHVHIDVILVDGTIIDLKTSEKRLGEGRAVVDTQLTTYAAALYTVYGHIPPAVVLDGLIHANPPKDVLEMHPGATKPWWDRQVATRTEEQINSWFASARRREYSRSYALTTGVYQTQGRSSLYACTNCPARSICPEWKGWEGLVEGSITHGDS